MHDGKYFPISIWFLYTLIIPIVRQYHSFSLYLKYNNLHLDLRLKSHDLKASYSLMWGIILSVVINIKSIYPEMQKLLNHFNC